MKSPKLKSRSAVTGKYATAKAAKAKPETHYKSDDYPARMLRRLVRMVEEDAKEDQRPLEDWTWKLIFNIKRRMGWDKSRKVK